MDVRNVTLKDFVYRGCDDCIAIKPHTFDIYINNITCEGGNGVAIGSLGQNLEDNTVENVVISGLRTMGIVGTIKMETSNVTFRSFTGNLKDLSGRLGQISCSMEYPCFGLFFEEMGQLGSEWDVQVDETWYHRWVAWVLSMLHIQRRKFKMRDHS
ncbi:hypothetical protein BBP40_003849 [Aspergillus hancockii]|nr:hypothetical protein BBP40_003849 [Aspergillus hancockii]